MDGTALFSKGFVYHELPIYSVLICIFIVTNIKKKHAMADFKVNPIVNGICEYNFESTEKHACIDASRVNNIIF